ncbi:MAG: hypothetical protein MRZ79_16900 [Bacteroidia bacterium]|nr:hypothetical protein [Bacteroidia bacterium]
MKYLQMFLILISPLILCAQKPQDIFSSQYPPHDYGISSESITGEDLADSVARLAISGINFFPQIQLGTHPNQLTWPADIWIRNNKPDSIYIGISGGFLENEMYPGEFRYLLRGVSIHRKSGFGLGAIYEDSLWESAIADTAMFKIDFETLIQGGEDGNYKLTFRELIRVDSKGRKFNEPTFIKDGLYFSISINRDPLSYGYGPPQVVLYVDDEEFHPGDFIPEGSQIILSLKTSPTFRRKYPAEQSYQIRGYRIIESGPYGRQEIFESKEVSDWGLYPKIEVPNDSIVVRFGGSFYLQLGEVYRKDPKGRKYRQDQSGTRLRFQTNFRKKR